MTDSVNVDVDVFPASAETSDSWKNVCVHRLVGFSLLVLAQRTKNISIFRI